MSADRPNEDLFPLGKVVFGVLAEGALVLLWSLSVTANWHDTRTLGAGPRVLRIALVSLPVMVAVLLWQRRVDRRLAKTRRDLASGRPLGRVERLRDDRRYEVGFAIYLTICLALLALGSIPRTHSSGSDTTALAVLSFCTAYMAYFCVARIRHLRRVPVDD